MYSDPKVASFVSEHFHPVRIHVRDDAEAWKTVGLELGVQWTPTILIVGRGGKEQHRIEGFLPSADFLASRYKASNDGAALQDTARAFRQRYAGTAWAKKASVWG